MAQENLNTSTPNDGLGDALRNAFIKVQSMFTELYGSVVFKVTGYDLSKNDFTDVLKGKLDNIEAFAEVNVQADWEQSDDTQDDYIKNKPSIPVLDDYILNGGYLGTGQDLYDLILAGSSVYFTDSGTTGIAVNLSTGVITVTMASFPTIAANGIIRGNFDVRVGSDWVSIDQLPEVTKTAGVITTASFYLNQSFDEIRGRIF